MKESSILTTKQFTSPINIALGRNSMCTTLHLLHVLHAMRGGCKAKSIHYDYCRFTVFPNHKSAHIINLKPPPIHLRKTLHYTMSTHNHTKPKDINNILKTIRDMKRERQQRPLLMWKLKVKLRTLKLHELRLLLPYLLTYYIITQLAHSHLKLIKGIGISFWNWWC